MVIRLEEWDKSKEYDRLGMEDQYTEFLGNKVICHDIPIRPGTRNSWMFSMRPRASSVFSACSAPMSIGTRAGYSFVI